MRAKSNAAVAAHRGAKHVLHAPGNFTKSGAPGLDWRLRLDRVILDADRITTRPRDDQADTSPVIVHPPDRHAGFRTNFAHQPADHQARSDLCGGGLVHPSLTKIAKKITGAHWSGPNCARPFPKLQSASEFVTIETTISL
jgi:hypothetical protein